MTESVKLQSGQEPTAGKRLAVLSSFALPVLVVGVLLFLMVSVRDGVETAVAALAGWLPVGYAFAAGMVASVNPCGFLLLPSYISYHLGTQEDGFYEQTVGRRVLKALLLGAWPRPGSWR